MIYPLIGITSRINKNQHNRVYDSLEHSYGAYFKSLGFLSLILPNYSDDFIDVLNALDLTGIVLSGGGDISNVDKSKDLPLTDDLDVVREQFEFELLTWAIANHVPVFGICRGMQLINAFFGGN